MTAKLDIADRFFKGNQLPYRGLNAPGIVAAMRLSEPRTIRRRLSVRGGLGNVVFRSRK